MTFTKTKRRPVGFSAARDRFDESRLGKSLHCQDEVSGGLPTPGLTSSDWMEDGPRNALAAEICDTQCDVADECLAYALAAKEPIGVWGGKTAMQRRSILRRAKESSTYS